MTNDLHHHTNKLLGRISSYRHTFLRGVVGGLGWSLGATIVIGLVFWVFSLLSQVPIIGDFIIQTGNIIQQNTPVR